MCGCGRILVWVLVLWFPATGWCQGARSATLWLDLGHDHRQRAIFSISGRPATEDGATPFIQGVGCRPEDLTPDSIASNRWEASCAAPGEMRDLTFTARWDIEPIVLFLQSAGVEQLVITVTHRAAGIAEAKPGFTTQGGRHTMHHRSWDLTGARGPYVITLATGYPEGSRSTLAGLMLLVACSPLLLWAARSWIGRREPDKARIRLKAASEMWFWTLWAIWLWAVAALDALPLSAILFRGNLAGMAALLSPPLAALWLGARIYAGGYVAFGASGAGEATIRSIEFWRTALAVPLFGGGVTLLDPGFLEIEGLMATILLVLGLAAVCLWRLRDTISARVTRLGDGPLRARIQHFADTAGLPLKDVQILSQQLLGGPAAFATQWGTVLLSEDLVRQLSTREVDAVAAHELGHFRRSSMAMFTAVPIVAFIVMSVLAPEWLRAAPLALVSSVLLFRLWRRGQEFAADAAAVRWSRDPEALISGLTRVSNGNRIPLSWGRWSGLWVSHPPTLERLRRIAGIAGMGEARLQQVIAEAEAPAADHYELPASSPVGSIAEMRGKMQQHLTWLMVAYPVVFAVLASVVVSRLDIEGPAVALAAGGALVAGCAGLHWLYELTVGRARSAMGETLSRRLAPAAPRPEGLGTERLRGARHFTAFSPGPDLLVYDGSYDYDFGFVHLGPGILCYAGDHASFSLSRDQVSGIRLQPGPSHWVNTPIVVIEYDQGKSSLLFRCFDQRHWPATRRANEDLYRRLLQWRDDPTAPAQVAAPPNFSEIHGTTSPPLSAREVFRSVRTYAMYAVVGNCTAQIITLSEGFQSSGVVVAALLATGILLMVLVPQTRDSRR